MLSLPVSLGAWYWGKFLGRFVAIFAPVFLAMALATAWGGLSGLSIPWFHFLVYSALLLSLSICFLGIGFLISTLARSSDVAQSAAFMLWLGLLLFLDLILLGIMLQERVAPEIIIGISLANPLQVFRTAAMALFDPQLVLLGPAAFVILDHFGVSAYLAWACAYPALIGLAAASLGFSRFRAGDLV